MALNSGREGTHSSPLTPGNFLPSHLLQLYLPDLPIPCCTCIAYQLKKNDRSPYGMGLCTMGGTCWCTWALRKADTTQQGNYPLALRPTPICAVKRSTLPHFCPIAASRFWFSEPQEMGQNLTDSPHTLVLATLNFSVIGFFFSPYDCFFHRVVGDIGYIAIG